MMERRAGFLAFALVLLGCVGSSFGQDAPTEAPAEAPVEAPTEAVLGASSASNTVITSDYMTVDYKRELAIFEGNVDVVHGDVKMKAEQMTVALGTEQDIKSITCKGHVRIWQRDRFATADKAIYVEQSGQMNLIGHATVKQGKSSLSGIRITFWRNADRLECEPGLLIVSPSEFQGKVSTEDSDKVSAEDSDNVSTEDSD